MFHLRQRLTVVHIAVLVLVVTLIGALAIVGGEQVRAEPASPARPLTPARQVAEQRCRHIDPNLVNGACLRYRSGGHSWFTWIGTYRARGGRVFFCIDYLYDSRLPGSARLVSTRRLVNQLGDRVGDAEVAALNYVVSTWAGRGSTGSDARDAAIALIIREVMSDGVRGDGAVVYPGGLRVGGVVQAPRGGLSATIVLAAQRMWTAGSRFRGPYDVALVTRDRAPLRLGQSRTYRMSVRGASRQRVSGLEARLSCSGPIRCSHHVTSSSHAVPITVRPRGTGRFTLTAEVTGPASDGQLYVLPGWHTHAGRTARDAGTQRGWIAQPTTARTSVAASAVIVRARPAVSTTTSDQLVLPGAAIADQVIVSGLPASYSHDAVATLYGPYAQPPTSDDCMSADAAGQVRLRVDHNGTSVTPTVTVGEVGYYTWTETLRGDRWTETVTTPCGVAAETTLARRLTPRARTVVSRRVARSGAHLHDVVRVSGLEPQTTVEVRWWLHGPVAPRGATCRHLSWLGAPLSDHGRFSAQGNGRFVTTSTLVRSPGCYTYSERLPGTAVTEPWAGAPGLPPETALVRRPDVPTVPAVPTGPLAGLPLYRPPARLVRPDAGGRLQIPSLGVDATVDTVGLHESVMAVPHRLGRLGWLSRSAAAGDVVGASVIAGHVTDKDRHVGVFRRLHRIRVGAHVTWIERSGMTHRFVVIRLERHSRSRQLPGRLFRTDGARVLRLVTCTGRKTGPGGRLSYTENLVVTAEPDR